MQMVVIIIIILIIIIVSIVIMRIMMQMIIVGCKDLKSRKFSCFTSHTFNMQLMRVQLR